MKNIDYIIFDLGGVIMNIDFQKTFEAFQDMLQTDFEKIYNQQHQEPIIDQIETGVISPAVFREGIRKITGLYAPDETIDDAWNALLLDFPKERIDLVKAVGKQKRVFLCSNTNAIHKEKADEIYANAFPGEQMESLFEKAYFSHLVKDRKPNPGIFQKIIDENGLEPKRTLFIDDTLQHIEGAQKVGLQTIHLKPPKNLLNIGLLD